MRDLDLGWERLSDEKEGERVRLPKQGISGIVRSWDTERNMEIWRV